MAEKRYKVDINLTGNSLLSAKLENLSNPLPTLTGADEGRVIYNTSDNKVYTWSGTAWTTPNGTTDLGQANGDATKLDVTSSTGTSTTLISATPTKAGLMSGADKTKLDDVIDDTIGNTPTLTKVAVHLGSGSTTDVLGATSSRAGVMTNTDKIKLDGLDNGANYIDPTKLVYKALADNGGSLSLIDWIKTSISLAGNSDNEVSTTKAVKAYVDAAVSGQGGYQGGYNAATNTPNLDVASTSFNKGDYFIVTTAGQFFSTQVQIGATLIAENDGTQSQESHWTIVQTISNAASEIIAGIIEIATQAETDAGTDDTRAITPKKLKAFVDSNASGVVRRKDVVIGDGASFAYNVTHGFNEQYVQVQVFEIATKEEVEVAITMNTVNSVTITFNEAPATNSYNVLIQG